MNNQYICILESGKIKNINTLSDSLIDKRLLIGTYD